MSSERPINPRFAEDLPFTEVDPPPTYSRQTDGPVAHLSVADGTGAVIGYVWANDADDAAGWVVPPGLPPRAVNAGASWLRALRSGKSRGLAPTALLAELAQGANDNKLSHAVPSSLMEAPSLAALKERVAGG
ncbi:hypothetical protein [Streptomyces sp. NBC_00582]|uniref:hypothetical protein n=1 Tax=Streptomyces sp. NBC_00582 TaxID=2975783 RepID=UPI0010632125|nr:hypothetical protein [Streptomyces sp. NBC_00582]WUB64734.1 hypothetical protein OG852_32180 [Streptomyces sp. NBC_00582]